MKVTVFGSTGKVGAHIARECSNLGHELTVYSRRATLATNAFKAVVGELDDETTLRQAIDGADVLISALANRDYASSVQVVTPFARLVAKQIQRGQRLIVVAGSGLMLSSFNQLRRDLPGQPPQLVHQRADHWDAYCSIAPLDIDCLFVCPTMIVDGDANGKYVSSPTYFPVSESRQIRAGNVAHYIANEVAQKNHVKGRVGLVGQPDEES